jgi:hypothetical protein
MVKAGRYVQGGGCLTVGVAGFVLGGGFGVPGHEPDVFRAL